MVKEHPLTLKYVHDTAHIVEEARIHVTCLNSKYRSLDWKYARFDVFALRRWTFVVHINDQFVVFGCKQGRLVGHILFLYEIKQASNNETKQFLTSGWFSRNKWPPLFPLILHPNKSLFNTKHSWDNKCRECIWETIWCLSIHSTKVESLVFSLFGRLFLFTFEHNNPLRCYQFIIISWCSHTICFFFRITLDCNPKIIFM